MLVVKYIYSILAHIYLLFISLYFYTYIFMQHGVLKDTKLSKEIHPYDIQGSIFRKMPQIKFSTKESGTFQKGMIFDF